MRTLSKLPAFQEDLFPGGIFCYNEHLYEVYVRVILWHDRDATGWTPFFNGVPTPGPREERVTWRFEPGSLYTASHYVYFVGSRPTVAQYHFEEVEEDDWNSEWLANIRNEESFENCIPYERYEKRLIPVRESYSDWMKKR